VNGSTPIDSDLLARYVSGEVDIPQRQRVEEWAALSQANGEELRRIQAAWDLSGSGQVRAEVDVDAAWSAVAERISDQEGKGRVRSIRWSSERLRWVAAAAVVTGVVFAVLWAFQPRTEHYAATSAMQDVLLPDRSRVVIAPGSALEVRMAGEREVGLRGSAYFEVQRDEARPFIVNTGDVQVTVLGTAFEVSAFDTASAITVRVRSGKVRVQAGDRTVDLVAGEHAVYNKDRHLLERTAGPPAEVWGWRVLQFEEAPLALVVEQLKRIYHVDIDLRNPKLARCVLTAEFDDESVSTILEVIAETFDLQLDQAPDGTYLLNGEGC
jgi:ferric-dicitrate binding protein FerR (iron transport regulator)